MKCEAVCVKCGCRRVAPLAGAWIEMVSDKINVTQITVAPLAGAWIEINARERIRTRKQVAPRMGCVD